MLFTLDMVKVGFCVRQIGPQQRACEAEEARRLPKHKVKSSLRYTVPILKVENRIEMEAWVSSKSKTQLRL